MSQAIAIAEFVTALTGNVLPADQAQRFFVATGEGNIHSFTSHAPNDFTQEVFAQLDEGLVYGVAAYVTADSVQHSIAATIDGAVYHVAANSQEHQLLANFESFSAVTAYAAPEGSAQYVVVATSEGSVYHLTLQGQDVQQQLLGTFESGVIGVSGFITPADGVQHIFIAASDGYIQHFTIRGEQPAEQQTLAFFEESFINLTSYLTADGLLNIVPATRDGKLYHVVYDASKGQEVYIDIRDGIEFHDASKTPGVKAGILQRFYLLNESGMMFITSYATANDNTQHVLVASSDGTITHIAFHGTEYDQLTHEVVANFQSMV
jgi:hypothetical protein